MGLSIIIDSNGDLLVIKTLHAEFIQEFKQFMSTYQDDITKLSADVAANTDAIKQVGTLVSADTATIADLKAQIAALPASVDTTGLEAAISSLEANNSTLSGLVPTPVAPDSPPSPTV